MSRHFVVVGGGLAGCSAALTCADAGARVTLLEARRRLGGATYSFQRDGLWFDNGQHVHLRCCTAYRAFIDRIGASDMVTMQRRLAIPVIRPGHGVAWIKRANLPAPLHLALSLGTYRHLSVVERLQLARALIGLMRLDLRDVSLDAHTFGRWLRARGQSDGSLEALWDLIVLPTVNLPSAEASLSLAAMVFKVGLLRDRSAADMGYTTTTLGRAHSDQGLRALRAAGVDVQLGVAVSEVGVEPGGELRVRRQGEDLAADAIVLAVPHSQAARLVPADADPEAARFADLGAVPIVNLHVIYDRPVMPHPFAAGVGTPVQWVFDRTQAAGLSEGQALAVSLSGAVAYAQVPTDVLREQFVAELARLFPRAREARVRGFYVTREHQATFRQGPGSLARRPGPRTTLPNLALAGAWTDTGWPATMEGAVRSGNRAADHALKALGLPTPVEA
ncbi:MAG: hydroxysqualene dehydroxylase HpnE [Chloroflexi bacterium]|nr:hydroxysqualene dehydroxylase HpnE [Chloroflexota bacterium]